MKIASFLLVFLLISCTGKKDKCLNKTDFQVNFKVLVKEHGERIKDLTLEEKEQYQQRFNEMVEYCYKRHKDQMSLRERQYFWKDAIVFLAKNNAEVKGENFNFTGTNDDLSPYIQSEFEQVIKDSGAEYGNTIKELLSEELPKIVDELVDEVEKLGEEIKEALKSNSQE